MQVVHSVCGVNLPCVLSMLAVKLLKVTSIQAMPQLMKLHDIYCVPLVLVMATST